MKKLAIYCMSMFFATAAMAQIETPQPSPESKIEQVVGLTNVKVEYSRPSMKGREIFGDLVPFGKLWRTGANASTKIEFSEPVKLNGQELAAGKYAVYTIPGEEKWTVVMHNNLEHWGTGDYNESEDALRFDATPVPTNNTVETFTIGFDNLRPNTGTLYLAWENTRVDIDIETNTADLVAKQIESFENPKPSYRPYYSAARYYYDTNKNLDKALEYANKAVEMSDAFWVLHLKAKIQHKNGDKKGAIKTAQMSMAKAKEAGNADYVALNEKLIAKCK